MYQLAHVADHGHHVLPQVGHGPLQQDLVRIGRAILETAGIDHINDLENLVIAPKGNGVHTTARVAALVEDLLQVVGSKVSVVDILRDLAEMATSSGKSR